MNRINYKLIATDFVAFAHSEYCFNIFVQNILVQQQFFKIKLDFSIHHGTVPGFSLEGAVWLQNRGLVSFEMDCCL